MNMRKFNFTIVELAVVISIIVILLSLLSPAFKRTIASAERVECAQVLSSLNVSLQFYEEDHHYMPSATQVIPGDRHHFWFEALDPYYEKVESKFTTEVQWCPSIDEFEPAMNSYGMNSFFILVNNFQLSDSTKGNASAGYFVRASAESSISNPSNTLLLADHGRNNNTAWTHPAIRHSRYFDGKVTNLPDFRHDSSKNVLFLDGHVTGQYMGDFQAGLVLK